MIKLTETAIKEVRRFMEDQGKDPKDTVLRVAVAGGGCAGFEYHLGFETKEEGDEKMDKLYEFENVTVKVDRKSELYLDGTTIDFCETLNNRGFAFENPSATKTCGCNSSFQ